MCTRSRSRQGPADEHELGGGTVRISRLSEPEAEIELCSCTGEPMERFWSSDPTVLQIGTGLLGDPAFKYSNYI
jgi:hypothetical protein